MGLACALVLASAVPVADDGFAARLDALKVADARVIRVGDRLARANIDRCRLRAPTPGWIVADTAIYAPERWPAVRAAYALPTDFQGAFVAATAPDGGAAVRGVTVGAPLSALAPDLVRPDSPAPYALIEAVHARWLLPAPPIADAPLACHVEWRVDADAGLRARADGRMVLITRGLVERTTSDDELAAVLAHEFAHHVAEHAAATQAAGRKVATRTRDQEREADRMSIGLMHRAGFAVPAALEFWRRYARGRSGILNWSATHDRWPTRIRAMERAWRAMESHDVAPTPVPATGKGG